MVEFALLNQHMSNVQMRVHWWGAVWAITSILECVNERQLREFMGDDAMLH